MTFFLLFLIAFAILWLILQGRVRRQKQIDQERIDSLSRSLEEIRAQLASERAARSAAPLEPALGGDLVYKRLRHQLEEKTETLHQARVELFHLEGKLIALQKESEHALLDSNQIEARLIEHLKECEEECQDLEAQLSFLLS